MPGTPIKCPGAPQKIMYLAADYFRRNKISANVIYGSAIPSIYGVKEYAAVLNKVVERYGIDARFNHDLVEVRPDKERGGVRDQDRSRARAASRSHTTSCMSHRLSARRSSSARAHCRHGISPVSDGLRSISTRCSIDATRTSSR